MKDAPTVDSKLENADTHNAKHAKVVEYKEAEKKRTEIENKVAEHETKIEKLTEEREKLIKNSKLPVPGLNFTSDGLTLNEVPFMPGKVSSSQEMEVAARLIIAKNPKVKIFRLSRGESLGAAKMEALVSFAKDNGYQGFIEMVVRNQDDLRVEEYTEQ